MKKQTKVKLSLISTIGVSLLAVSSAAVSTFAWFQAQAQVNVSASSADPVEITVAAPEDCKLNTPVLYKSVHNGTKGYTGTLTDTTVTNVEHFTVCESFSDLNSVSNLWPGYKMSFAIYCTAVSKTKGTLTLSSFNAGADENRLDKDYDNDTYLTKYIDFARALNFYTGYSTSATFSVGSTDKFAYSSSNVITSAELVGSTEIGATAASTAMYFFITIKFDDSDTTYYKEYKEAECTNEVETTPTSGTRYFKKHTSGNSNCYENLTFSMTTLTLGEIK